MKRRIPLYRYGLMTLAAVLTATPAPALAVDFDAEQNRLQGEIEALENGPLQSTIARANSLEEAISILNAQITELQNRIVANQAKRVELNASIDKAQTDIQVRTEALGQNLKSIYVDSEITDLEKVASSKSISEFIDKEEYRNKIRDKVQAAMKQIKALKAQLEGQRAQVEQLIRDDESLRGQVDAQKAVQAKLLADTRGEEAEFKRQIAAKQSEISALEAAQIAANQSLGGVDVRAGDPGRGGYPAYLDAAAKDALVDPWGMYNRECVSYTAWKVHQKTGRMPYWGGRGNANQWPSSARTDGIPTGSTPRVGSVAISMAGYYGHSMWVEAVHGNGMITVSQYNYDWNGYYSEMTISGAGLVYIYF